MNSTNGRFDVRLRLAAFRMLSVVAPAAAERRAVELFRRPMRAVPASAPEVPGVPAHRFSITSGRFELAAWDWGKGPTVLLVHGWSGQAGHLAGFVSQLVAAGFHVVAFDQPAHGSSSGESVTVVDFAEAVLAVARRVGPLHGVIAHSLGATGTALALGRGLQADRVVLLAPPAEVAHFARAHVASLGLPSSLADGLLAHLRRELGDLDALDVRRLARGLSVPLLLMHDPEDREVPFAHGQAIAAAWPGGRLEVLERLGHRRLLRDPGVIRRAVAFVCAPEANGIGDNDASRTIQNF